MSNLNFKKSGEKEGKKGVHFYVALGICVIAVAVAAFTTYDSIKRFAGTDEEIIASKTQQKSKVQNHSELNNSSNMPKNKSVSNANENQKYTGAEKENKEIIQEESVETNANSAGVIVYPTSKEVLKQYSGENPVYSKTLNDWRVHNGLDLSAEQGSKVKAITNGKVKDIYNDSLLGTTMVIEHVGDFTAYYSGLGETTLVNKGDTVESGQEIASINDIPCESADGYHLHLAIKKDNKFINPQEVLGQ